MFRTSIAPRCALALLLYAAAALPTSAEPGRKIGPLAHKRSAMTTGSSRVIVRAADDASASSVESLVHLKGGRVRRSLPLINAAVVDLPNAELANVSANAAIARVSLDRKVVGTMERTGATVGASALRQEFGYDGSGIGVAIIDSGITVWHDDLSGAGGGQRVSRFVDLVNDRTGEYDDYGHGTHVAGIVAGNGHDSSGARTGIAPGAHLVVIKALDASGSGYISDVIAALDFVVAHKDIYNIRVVNLSIASAVYESYETDPLTVAAKRAADAGIVVVAAAGNRGRNPGGRDAYGGVTAPGNAPWVLTVGASSHRGTTDRADDVMAVFSSRGPTAVTYSAKPDLVAPGVGIESLSDPYSAFYGTKASYLLNGTVPTWYQPYLSLSGTSMAAPVVSGAVALMLQANPSLTPNQVKAILQYTAQVYGAYDPLTEGAGFLNAKGAVDLARFFATPSIEPHPVSTDWSRRLIWGNRLVSGGRLMTAANAWSTSLTWGAAATAEGQPIEWGWFCATDDCGTSGVPWQPWTLESGAHNVVWGLACGGADCSGDWLLGSTGYGQSVVWGTSDAEGVVWGTSDQDESVVWGTGCDDAACEPVVWPHE
jgi:serine protease AprX